MVKKSVIALLLLCFCFSACGTLPSPWLLNATAEEKYHRLKIQIDRMYQNKKLPFPTVSESLSSNHKNWLLGLSGMLSERNFQNVKDLSPDRSDFMKQVFTMTLSRDWGIENRTDLYEQIRWCLHEGHSKQYKSVLALVNGNIEMTYSQFKAIRASLTENQFHIIKQFSDILGDRELKAWDYGRAAWLARMGYMLNLITEDEAWEILEEVGVTMRREYTSWSDYGANYCIGRVFWGGIKEADRTINTYNSLNGWRGAWSSIPWEKESDLQ